METTTVTDRYTCQKANATGLLSYVLNHGLVPGLELFGEIQIAGTGTTRLVQLEILMPVTWYDARYTLIT